jgi:hypothetical protein
MGRGGAPVCVRRAHAKRYWKAYKTRKGLIVAGVEKGYLEVKP